MRRSIRSVRVLLLAAAMAAAAPLAAQESTNYSYTWWNAAEPGWGYNLSHQGDLLYGTWYSYAEDGKPMFLTVEGLRNEDGSFSGPVYRVAGTPFQQINGSQAFTAVTEVGSAQMSFAEDGSLDLTYTIDGTTQTRTLTRFTFSDNPPVCVGTTESRASASNYSDLWWNPTEAGWGLTLSHQGDVIFVLWYTYGEGGRDQWISASTLVRQPDGSYTGALQRPNSGTPLLQIAGAATTFPVPEVGSATLSFSDGENGSFTYTLDGVTQTKAITRFVAVGADQPKPLCRVEEGGGGGGGGSGEGCFPDNMPTGKTLDYRLTYIDGATATEMVEVMGPAMFNGFSAIRSEQRQPNGDYNEIFQRYEGANIQYLGDRSYTNNDLAAETTFAAYPTKPIAPVLNTVYDETYPGMSRLVPLGITNAITYRDSLVFRRRESVTVPAGTFDNACYVERIIEITSSGFTIRIDFEMWLDPEVGEVKSIGTGTSVAGPFRTTKELTDFNIPQ
ncbi:MAG: hypothetical protein KDI48_09685 [Xanthomonadales bacterium]|nr:hypothetical protein [Xanthomonadales bacterium]